MQACGRKAVRGKKVPPKSAVRTAEQPGQTINVDVCYVPEQHEAQVKLPAVSGSSGHLLVERNLAPGEERHWPGQVFGEMELAYEAAMHQYSRAAQDRLVPRSSERTPSLSEKSRHRHRVEDRAERYQVREQRKHEDLEWKRAKTEWRLARQAYQALLPLERNKQLDTYQDTRQAWKAIRQQHLITIQRREQEDQVWHQHNREREIGSSQAAEESAWIAILVVTDNCTRQCLGLPLFKSGPKLSSGELVKALRATLPKELLYVISDQGSHFRSNAFASLAKQAHFIHVPVYRHRPESNGIAERFVLTLKKWLRAKSWNGVAVIYSLLSEFQQEYNDRPHQGLAIPGLSPNEFALRVWLL